MELLGPELRNQGLAPGRARSRRSRTRIGESRNWSSRTRSWRAWQPALASARPQMTSQGRSRRRPVRAEAAQRNPVACESLQQCQDSSIPKLDSKYLGPRRIFLRPSPAIDSKYRRGRPLSGMATKPERSGRTPRQEPSACQALLKDLAKERTASPSRPAVGLSQRLPTVAVPQLQEPVLLVPQRVPRQCAQPQPQPWTVAPARRRGASDQSRRGRRRPARGQHARTTPPSRRRTRKACQERAGL